MPTPLKLTLTIGGFTFPLDHFYYPTFHADRSPSGELDKTIYSIEFNGMIKDASFSALVAIQNNIRELINSKTPVNILIKEGATLRESWLAADFEGSPYIDDFDFLPATEASDDDQKQLRPYRMVVTALKAGDKIGARSYDVQRDVTDEIYNNKLNRKLIVATARGTNAVANVLKLKPKDLKHLRETYRIGKDENSFSATWEFIPSQTEGFYKWSEQINIVRAASTKYATLISGGLNPIIGNSRVRPCTVTVVGFIQGYAKVDVEVSFEPLFGFENLDVAESELNNLPFPIEEGNMNLWQRNYKEFYVFSETPDILDVRVKDAPDILGFDKVEGALPAIKE